MTARGLIILAVLLAPIAFAQTQDERIAQLEHKLDALLRQAEEIRQELQQLKPAVTDGLRSADVTTATPTLTDVQPVENQIAPGASKALNPDISVIGTFLAHAGDTNEVEQRAPAELDEAEVALEAFIDPYAKGRFFIAVTPDEVDVEEGYAQFVTLPWGLTARAGKTKASFGKANRWHTHTRPWVDQPLMLTRFLGEEGLADVGVSVSRDVPNPFGAFMEATGEIYSGDVEEVFGRASANDLFYNAHLEFFRDIGENSNIEVGTSWARGTLPPEEEGIDAGHSRIAGMDITYRWKPLSRSIYSSFVARFEGLSNRRSDVARNLYGYFLSADYQFARRWFAGVRADRADRFVETERLSDRALSATLTFWPSEFSQFRAQYRRTKPDGGPELDELLLQLQFSIGAHGAHIF